MPVQQSNSRRNPTFQRPMRVPSLQPFGRASILLFLMLFAGVFASGRGSSEGPASRDVEPLAPQRLTQTIEGLKQSEKAMYLFERTEREEDWKDPRDPQPEHIKVMRVFPAGTGIGHIVLSEDGKPPREATYKEQLAKLLKSVEWAAQDGGDQKKAYARIDKKLKDRFELIDATRSAFVFTYVGREFRDGRPLLKYRMEPNPSFKPTNRTTAFFTKVKGYVWIDEATSQLAKVEGEVIDDISFGIFLGKIYKGSHFMQERYPDPSGVWLPSVTQYDFDGRKFFSSISIHERTYYTNYRRVGPPREALPLLRSELARLERQPPASASAASGP